MRLLVVEDEKAVRISMINFFKRRNNTVFEAENGSIALDILEREEIDIIISDIKLPVLDGIGLLKIVKEKYAEIDVILVTGYANLSTAIAATRYNAHDYLKKPYNLAELNHIVKRIKEKRHIKKELKQKQKQLIQTQKLASLGTLSASIMHEINTPNTFILGNCLFIKKHLKNFFDIHNVDDKNKELLTDILNSFDGILNGAERIDKIIKKIPYLSQKTFSHNEQVNVKKIIVQALELLKSKTDSKVNINTTFCPDSPIIIVGNEHELLQVFLHLLNNSLYAIKKIQHPQINIDVMQKKTDIIIKFQDNGPGIKPENFEKIFEPFFSTKPVGKGLGLGLYIVYELVTNNGGRISVQPEKNRGAVFEIIFKN